MNSLKLICDDGAIFNTISVAEPPSGGNAYVLTVAEDAGIVAKVLKPEMNHDNPRDRFLYEMKLLEKYSKSTTKVPCFKAKGFVEGMNTPFYLMEKLYTWDSFIKKIKTFDEKINICSLLLDAIEQLHKLGIAHRDIKPKNLLFRLNQGVVEVVLADLGLAISDDRDEYETKLYEMLGSKGFRPFELTYHNPMLKTEDYFFSDVYQFVKTVYCIFANKTYPFSDDRHSIGKNEEIKQYQDTKCIESVYQMVEKGIRERYFERPTIVECKEMLRKISFFNKSPEEYSNYIKDRELRRLNDTMTQNNRYFCDFSPEVAPFINNFFKAGSTIRKVYGSREKFVIKEINDSRIVTFDEMDSDDPQSIDKGSSSPSNVYQIMVQNEQDLFFCFDFIIRGLLVFCDKASQRRAHVLVRNYDCSANLASEYLEEYDLESFAKQSDAVSMPTNLFK